MTKIPPMSRRSLVLGGMAMLPTWSRARQLPETGPEHLLFVGTYTKKDSKGIYVWRFNSQTGALTPIGLAAETENPSFLAIHPKAWFLYAVNETGNYQGKPTGSVSSFTIDQTTGKLTFINQVASGGADPCDIVIDHTGHTAAVANYTGGSFALFPITRNGELGEASQVEKITGKGPNKERQEGPHTHSVNIARDNKSLIVTDLGTDKVLAYHLSAEKSTIQPAEPPFVKVPDGDGPRHSVFSRDSRFLYVLSEMGSSVTTFKFDANSAKLERLTTVNALPSNYKGPNDAAEIAIDRENKFLYTTNRGHDSLAVFAVTEHTGALKLVDHVQTGGQHPRHFTIDPSGNWLLIANMNSDNIVVFSRDRKTGVPKPTGVSLYTGAPVCLKFVRS
jgi:6-phosphogluconolactonase